MLESETLNSCYSRQDISVAVEAIAQYVMPEYLAMLIAEMGHFDE